MGPARKPFASHLFKIRKGVVVQAPAMAPAPTVAIAAAPAFAADTQTVAPAAAMPLSQSTTEDATSHGAAPVSAPAGEAAPAVPVHYT